MCAATMMQICRDVVSTARICTILYQNISNHNDILTEHGYVIRDQHGFQFRIYNELYDYELSFSVTPDCNFNETVDFNKNVFEIAICKDSNNTKFQILNSFCVNEISACVEYLINNVIVFRQINNK